MKVVTFLWSTLLGTFLFTKAISQNNVEYIWKTDTTKKGVELSELQTVLERDAIPSIDRPLFIDKEKATSQYFNQEPVIAVELEKEVKGYPLSILMFHEIANDKINGIPIAVTYCPLCNSGIVFDRRISHDEVEQTLEFGVSGMLRNSDMVMWDRQTESWWQQFNGTSIVGKFVGKELEQLPSMMISVEDFFKNYPNGMMLSKQTGWEKSYGKNPYVNYDQSTHPRLFNGKIDNRLPPMERVIDIPGKQESKIYPLSTIRKKRVINDVYENQPVVIFFKKGTVSAVDEGLIKDSKDIGSASVFSPLVNNEPLQFKKTKDGIKDVKTGSLWSITGKCIDGFYLGTQLRKILHGNHFAFAWFAFNPKCSIYQYK